MQKETLIVKIMGTRCELMVVHPNGQRLLRECEALLELYNQRFSANDPSSELGQVNQAAGVHPVRVHPELFELISIGKRHSLPSDSYLNIALGPLVQTWRIGFADANKPSQAAIDQALQLTDPHLIELDEENMTVYLMRAGMAIDLGAIAKGYIADRLADHLRQAGVASGLVNLGGNLITIGPALNRADYYWRIGIQDPTHQRGDSLFALKIYNQSVVTSGIYERKLTVDGQTYHHIFDQKTGYPIINDIASITIVADQSIDCEIWTTRLFGYSSTEIMERIAQLEGIEGVVITQDGQAYISQGLTPA